MRKAILPVSTIIIACIVCSVSAQQAITRGKKIVHDTTGTASGKVAPLPVVEVYLGNTGQAGGTISKDKFDAAAKLGLTLSAHENGGFITSFRYLYAERGLYEDSVGNPIISTDYLSQVCDGATLPASIQADLTDRTKAGDTAYFTEIKLHLPNGRFAHGKVMKFIITK